MRSKFKWIFTLLVALTMQFSFAQEKTVTGVVSDDLGPVAGASVVVKGTTTGTTTDFDGNYAIAAKAGDVLEISYVGNKQEVTVGAANVYNVTLSSTQLEEVVVTGALGIKRKADEVTSSYTVVKTEELTQAAAPTVAQALVGKVSGLTITTTNSSVNSTNRIVINGNRSITGNNEALVVIDNAISTATVLQSMPPDAIESINVIKGAQGAALYGSDGANGVIVVTTKKGVKGSDKVRVSLSSAIDFQQVAYLPVRQTRYGQGWFGEHYAIENGAWGPEMNGSLMPVGLPQADGSQFMAPYTGDSDNIKDFFKTGTLLQNGVAISAGSLTEGFFNLSINRQDRDFVIEGDQYKRTNFNFRAGKKVGNWTVDGGAQYYSARTHVANTNQANGSAGIYALLLQTATNIPVGLFENSGNNGHWNVYYRSPYWMRDNLRSNTSSDFFSGNLSLQYDFNDHINVRWNPNVQITTNGTESFVNAFGTGSSPEEDIYASYSARNVVSNYASNTNFTRRLYSDIFINFDYDLTESLKLQANLGNNIRETYYKRNSVGGSNLDTYGTFYNYENVLNPDQARDLRNLYEISRKASVFANIDLGYKGFLNLNITARNDWTSVLDPNNRSFFYPGAGLSFVPTKAFPGLKSNVLNYAKVYASYTGTGNDSNVQPFEINPIGVVGAGFPFGSLSSYVGNQSPTYAFILPERNYTRDFGISLGFLNDRITFDGQYYYTQTKDLVTFANTSNAAKINQAKLNIGELHNTGFNLDLGFTPFKAKSEGDFEWTGKANLSHSRTVIDDLGEGVDELSLLDGGQVGVFAIKGEEFPSIKGIGYQRDAAGNVIINANTGNPLYTSQLQNFGRTTPDYVLGFTNSFSYKGVKLTAVCDYRTGGVFYSGVMNQLAWTGHLVESAENGRAGGFIFPNSVYEDPNNPGQYLPNTNIVTGGNSYASYQTYFSNDYSFNNVENNILDGTKFQVREVALSYSIPAKLLKNTGVSAMSLGINARNVFMWLPKENKYYADPESSYTTDTFSNGSGYTVAGQYPLTRTYGFSLNLTF